MNNAFAGLLSYITNALPTFLLSEPVVQFVAAFMLVFVIGLVARLFHSSFR